ncbi:MAG TPA: hypothetical protein DEA78_22575 [Cyanobacteria bacterium UBA11159]|nr:hypothetical protein [Cyanobacteria bacterium UBA11366]HBK62434.1 hypothetical protein [Cyanobacteria bacterium UBA11166]HBR76394.1 hypothetical protein [Cyanobacteria bacterium UBA11159]HBS72049.1 hypothetical protein [Cyanobacteria bacterium UBA11153]
MIDVAAAKSTGSIQGSIPMKAKIVVFAFSPPQPPLNKGGARIQPAFLPGAGVSRAQRLFFSRIKERLQTS